MISIEIIGLFAGMLTTGSQIPQAIKVYRTRSTGDLSALWVSILLAGTCVWLYYGLAINDLPLILWNGLSIAIMGYIAFQKYRDIGPQIDRLLSGPFAIIKNEKRTFTYKIGAAKSTETRGTKVFIRNGVDEK